MSQPSIPNYVIDRQVSWGGLSTVYAAHHAVTGQPVAIKYKQALANPEYAVIRERFLTEYRALSSINHPSLTAVHEIGFLDDGSPFIVMEWLEGTTLDALLKSKGKLPLHDALEYAYEIADALGAVHASGAVHRDIKPANLMVMDAFAGSAAHIKVLDFGTLGELNESNQTRAGDFYGTAYYMSPEQIRAESISPSSDIWQLGVTTYQMLLGTLPFDAQNAYELLPAILNKPATIPPDADLPPRVSAFLLSCLEKDPSKRPANGKAAAQLIDDILTRDEPPQPTAASAPDFSIPAPAASAPAPVPTLTAPSQAAPQPTASRQTFSSSAIWLLAGLCIVLAAVVLVESIPHLSAPWKGILLGAGITLSGILLGLGIRKFLSGKKSDISLKAGNLLSGARDREALSQTMAIQVDAIVARCHDMDEKFLGMTMAVMVSEYSQSASFDDRQKALMNAVTLLEKLTTRLSPWYVRNDKLVAFLVTLIGIASGLVTIAQNVAKLIKGS